MSLSPQSISPLLAAFALSLAAAEPALGQACAEPPSSPRVVNVTDKGAKGDGRTNDTDAIQAAIDEIAGSGGTVLVPDGTYMVTVTENGRLKLKSDMTLRLTERAALKAIPNREKKYSVLLIEDASNVTIVGGSLLGERAEHKGKVGEWGMGIFVGRGTKHITINGVTARDMWGDGFYVQGAKDVNFCGVVADHNRRQGLSIVDADGVLVSNSVFKNTRGTRPSAGIDLEPDGPEHKVVDVRIEDSKFLDNAGAGIQIAGKKGLVSKVSVVGNLFKNNRPLLVENAPKVRSDQFCDNRQVGYQSEASGGLNAFADPVEVVALQSDCSEGRDIRFEVNRDTKKRNRPR